MSPVGKSGTEGELVGGGVVGGVSVFSSSLSKTELSFSSAGVGVIWAGGGAVGVSAGVASTGFTGSSDGLTSVLVGSVSLVSSVFGVSLVNPNVVSNSAGVNPFKTAIVPSSFSTLVTGVPAKLLETASISVKKSLLVSRFFSS